MAKDSKRQNTDGWVPQHVMDDRYAFANEPKIYKLRQAYLGNKFGFYGGTFDSAGNPKFTDKGKQYDWKGMRKAVDALNRWAKYQSTPKKCEEALAMLRRLDVVVLQLKVDEVKPFNDFLKETGG